MAFESLLYDDDSPKLGWNLTYTPAGEPERPFNSGDLEIASIAADGETGRMFLMNEGDFKDKSYMWVLTPAVIGDVDADGDVDDDDVATIQANIGLSDPDLYADVDLDWEVDQDDLDYMLNVIMGGVEGDITGDGVVDDSALRDPRGQLRAGQRRDAGRGRHHGRWHGRRQ